MLPTVGTHACDVDHAQLLHVMGFAATAGRLDSTVTALVGYWVGLMCLTLAATCIKWPSKPKGR